MIPNNTSTDRPAHPHSRRRHDHVWLSIAAAILAMIGSVIGLALRGSLRAYLMWLGVVTFTVYNYVIYTFSVPFGPIGILTAMVLAMLVWLMSSVRKGTQGGEGIGG